MIELKDAEERAFWDAAFIAGMHDPVWDRSLISEPREERPMSRPEWAALIADRSLEQRRMRIRVTA